MSSCGFCHGRPVLNAAAWTTWGAPHYAPCPRCGELNLPDVCEDCGGTGWLGPLDHDGQAAADAARCPCGAAGAAR